MLPGLHLTTNGTNVWIDQRPRGKEKNLLLLIDLKEITTYWVEVSNTCSSTNSRTAIISSTITGLTQSASGMFEVKTHPNPVSNKLTVESEQFKVMGSTAFVYDFYGRQIFEKYIPAGTESLEIDISNLVSGFYFCRIVSKEYYVIKKIIKL